MKDKGYTLEKLAKDLAKDAHRKERAKHRGSRACWYISICWQILGIFGMIMHIDDANTCEIIGALWMIVALLVRREE